MEGTRRDLPATWRRRDGCKDPGGKTAKVHRKNIEIHSRQFVSNDTTSPPGLWFHPEEPLEEPT